MSRTISLANQKGGVGKTTSTINLGASLAELGQRVLLVDFDPQGAATVGVGLNPNELDLSIYNLLLDPGVDAASVIMKSPKAGIDVLPANIDLAAAEVVLVGEVAREQALDRALRGVKDEYDYILIDCPPSLGLLTVNALTASDTVIIPMECEFFALRGMALLMDTIRKIQERLNPQLEVQGIVATMYDSRTLHSREVLARVREAFGDLLFKTHIARTIRFAEAPVAGEAILTYAPTSSGAAAYRALAKEVLGVDHEESKPAESGRAVQADDRTAQLDAGSGGSREVPADIAIDTGEQGGAGDGAPDTAGDAGSSPSDASGGAIGPGNDADAADSGHGPTRVDSATSVSSATSTES